MNKREKERERNRLSQKRLVTANTGHTIFMRQVVNFSF